MLLTVEQLKQASVMHSDVAKFLETTPLPAIDHKDYISIRTIAEAGAKLNAATLGPPGPEFNESFIDIPMRDGFINQLKVLKPTSPPPTGSPLIVLSFGGGWIYGNNSQMDSIARLLVKVFGAVVVNISYRLAPEYPFPTPTQDGFDSVKWIAANASQLDADPILGFIVGGISAGAVTSAIVARMAQIEPLAHALTGQWLCVPSIFNETLVPEKFKHLYLSRKDNAEAPVLSAAALNTMQACCNWEPNEPWRFPTASKHSLTGLPAAYLQADGMDPVRDDALIFDEVLKEAGVPTRIDLYDGCPHAHFSFMPSLPVSVKGVADVLKGFGWLLGKALKPEDLQCLMGTK